MPRPLTLVLLRHGESHGNARGTFTGWIDTPLTARGEQQAREAGHLLLGHGLRPTRAHSSNLVRAIRTCTLALAAAHCPDVSPGHTWRLNERHYGALQGLERSVVRARYGAEAYRRWRRSVDAVPPPLPEHEAAGYAGDPRYGGLDAARLPRSESLADVLARLLPYLDGVVAPELRAGHTVLVTAHSNSLRALVSHLDGLTPEETAERNIPTGMPLCYELDAQLRPLLRGGRYLDPEAARSAAKSVAEQGF
ncbi:2,3-bisphosphoglycerate-dependent phosphoglycerate mutase [Streptomyces sp. SKN60]|uniref:2,3-bisphosphoglycerate-dependent phosphoglycerate mutase n=1 Tax=Streptomyces sp. SKN60 TaxID=2855506 RepID=UPI0022456EEF|nr:2,3-bisphosphoglycerate-dependent phosphoglycerate mutase [Streptomyces sp. SKN60]MCX2180224.1 2,3-bisphosphoglycerate-dependent phosphoglycerate mutase [Streptomyces sp. SKN60]